MSRKIIGLAFGIMLLGFNHNAKSQDIKHKFDRITVKDGLAHSTVNYIIQDKTGFMWFATYGGISRFDGYSFTTYSHDPEDPNSISGNGIAFIFEDSKGHIWAINNGEVGLDRFDPVYKKFTNFRHDPNDENSLSDNIVNHITEDSKGRFWIATREALNLLTIAEKDTTVTRYYYPEGIINLAWIIEGEDDLLFLFGNEVYTFNTETEAFTATNTRIGTTDFNNVARDEEGNIYLGTLNLGVVKLKYDRDNNTFESTENTEHNQAPNTRGFPLIGPDKKLWVGTENRGLYVIDSQNGLTDHFLHIEQDDESLSDNTVYSLFADRTGLLWIGTLSQGLCTYDLYQKQFYHYSTAGADSNSLSGNLMSSLHSISSGELWAGIQGQGGVNRLVFDKDETVKVIKYKHDPENPNSLATNNNFSLVQRRDGTVWAGGGATQLSKITPEIPFSGEEPKIERIPVNGWTFVMYEDSEGILWGGTWGGGLWRYDDFTNSFKIYSYNPDDPTGICDDVIWSIYEDNQRNIWIGGNKNGLSILRYRDKLAENPEFLNFEYNLEDSTSLSNNTINAMVQAKDGTMWLATNGGINQLLNSTETIQGLSNNTQLKFRSFTEEDGLPSNAIIGAVEDLQGNLWLATGNGLSFFDLNDTTFSNYYETDGLQSDEYWHNSYFRNSEGKVFFGGKNGISAFYPKDIKANPFVPELVITDLKIFNKSVKIGEKVNKDIILEKSLQEQDKIVLSHRNNVFTIEFAALHFTQPYKNQYAYYLEGFEEDWNYVDNIRSATYTNLDPGKYTFRVKGSNNNGIWNEDGTSIEIRVKAAWWNTWLFRILILIVIGIATYYFVRSRIEAGKREKALLKEKIEEGERELQIRKDEIEKQKQAIEEQNQKEYEIRYQHTGISKFAEIINSSRKNLSELSTTLIMELVKYTETAAGVIFLAEDSNPSEVKLENVGSYCFDSSTIENKVIYPGEGSIGTCFQEKQVMKVDNLPEGYVKLSSGLGNTSLRHSVFIPVLNESNCLGVIEIASTKPIEAYKVELITKLSENYASVVAISKANEKTHEMLEQNKVQAEELMSKEEELRQNLEEMQATQEELRRQMEASEKANEAMLFEQTLTKALLKNAPESIYFKDLQSRFLKASESMKDVFNVKHVEDIYGKTDFDFFTDDHARPAFEDEQNIIKTGKPIIDKIEKETHANGRVSYVTTTKMPLKDTEGKIIGTFGISRNITELVEMKEDLERREEEMTAKDEKIKNLQQDIKRKVAAIKELEEKLKG